MVAYRAMPTAVAATTLVRTLFAPHNQGYTANLIGFTVNAAILLLTYTVIAWLLNVPEVHALCRLAIA